MNHKFEKPFAGHARMSGFTLLEVLISLMILSIGLLGVAGLQITSLRNNHSAYLRTQASALAYDMADRMRTNSQATEDGDYDQANNTQHTDCLAAGGCRAADLAEHDTYEWEDRITALLPSGQGLICKDSTPTTTACDDATTDYVIKVWWDGDRDGALDTPYVFTFQP